MELPGGRSLATLMHPGASRDSREQPDHITTAVAARVHVGREGRRARERERTEASFPSTPTDPDPRWTCEQPTTHLVGRRVVRREGYGVVTICPTNAPHTVKLRAMGSWAAHDRLNGGDDDDDNDVEVRQYVTDEVLPGGWAASRGKTRRRGDSPLGVKPETIA